MSLRSPLGDSGTHTSPFCSKDRSLSVARCTALRTLDRAARSQGLSTTLELSSFSSATDLPGERRRSSLRATDLATTSPMSLTHQYSCIPSSLEPERLLKKREAQKASKYRTLAESQGGELDPLAVGAHGSATSSTKKALQEVCSSKDATDPKLCRCACDYWVAKTSLSLQRAVAREALARPVKASGLQYSGFHAASSFPDSVGTHFDMSG